MGKDKVKQVVEDAYVKIKKRDFEFFLRNVFARGFKKLEGKEWIGWDDPKSFPAILVDSLENHDRSSTIGPRDFGKTHIFTAYALYRMITAEHRMQIYYLSYKQSQAEGFIKKIAKPVAEESPLISAFFHNDFSRAKTSMDVTNPLGYQAIMEPKGLLGSIRGEHADLMLVDDPLKDESAGETPNPTQVQKATKRFFEDSVPMIKNETGECHVIGTAISPDDLLHQLQDKKGWRSNRIPAVKDVEWDEDQTRIVGGKSMWPKRWPSAKNFNKKLNDTTLSGFKKEYLCIADRDVDTFLSQEKLDKCFGLQSDNSNFEELKKGEIRLVGGHDIGKKVDPAHAIIFALDEDNELYEWTSKFMDGWEYQDQVEWWKTQFNRLPIYKAFYDDQRSEFEGFREKGELPSNFEPQKMNYQQKYNMAAELETYVNEGKIHFKNDSRIYQSLLSVGDDLKATRTESGHGDAFFSTILAVFAARSVIKLKQRFVNPSHQMDSNKKLKGNSRWKFLNGV